MEPSERVALKQTIMDEIEAQRGLIESLAENSRPVSPDNAIGRLTRMEAINSKSISEASLNSARQRLSRLEIALTRVDQPEFGLCRRCQERIPTQRILLMPETTLCVSCAELTR